MPRIYGSYASSGISIPKIPSITGINDGADTYGVDVNVTKVEGTDVKFDLGKLVVVTLGSRGVLLCNCDGGTGSSLITIRSWRSAVGALGISAAPPMTWRLPAPRRPPSPPRLPWPAPPPVSTAQPR